MEIFKMYIDMMQYELFFSGSFIFCIFKRPKYMQNGMRIKDSAKQDRYISSPVSSRKNVYLMN